MHPPARAAAAALVVLACAALVAVAGCGGEGRRHPASERPAAHDSAAAVSEITRLVERFGERMKLVSLLAPDSAVTRSLREQYAELVTPELLERWIREPRAAPGRLVSSPWPERIKVQAVSRSAPDSYDVRGELLERTNADPPGSGRRTPVRLVVERVAGSWRIAAYEPGGDSAAGVDSLGAGGAVIVLRAYYDAIGSRRYRENTLRRSVVEGAGAAQRRWRIYAARLLRQQAS
jgi:hypothetical protein